MFWLPRKKIIAPRHKQRGNICFEVGLPPQALEPVAGDLGPGWSRIEEFRQSDGDMSGITAAYTNTRISGFFWKPDGTKITIANTSDDNIKTFNLSSPWDLNTATPSGASIGVTNPGNLKVNAAGTRMFAIIIVGDEIAEYALTDYAVTNNTKLSNITKSDVGFTGSVDGLFIPDENFTKLYYEGQISTSEYAKLLNLTPDLDNFTTQETYGPDGNINPSGSRGFSPFTKDGKSYYKCMGSPGLRRRDFTTAYLPSTVVNYNAAQESISGLTLIDLRPDHMWFNPNDTREVWLAQDITNNIKFGRYATNIPEI